MTDRDQPGDTGDGIPDAPVAPSKPTLTRRLLTWAIAFACFGYLYYRIDSAAAREGETAISFLTSVFTRVSWTQWLMLMIPYSCFYFLIDSAVAWRVINWFNAKVPTPTSFRFAPAPTSFRSSTSRSARARWPST